MAAAYFISYEGPRGPCPDAVCIFASDFPECVIAVARQAKAHLVAARNGEWDSADVRVRTITYLGPWFDCTEKFEEVK